MRGFDSGKFWESRYATGGNSGAGSYGRLAEFKAEVINQIIQEKGIGSVVDWGVGDGNQLTMLNVANYLGVDVSQTVVNAARDRWAYDSSKKFIHVSELPLERKRDLSMSVDVIFHLVEDRIFNQYMQRLVDGSDCYVLVYSSNYEGTKIAGHHVRHRKFTVWMKANAPEFRLIEETPNRYPFDESNQDNTSFADFYLFERLN
ncbi:hypothetical protein N9C70_01855 [Flavobacteriales bacterium]|nr:hypothetical protein [Flavobacteriales bacterium]